MQQTLQRPQRAVKIPDRLNVTVSGPLASTLEQQLQKAIRESLEEAKRAKVSHDGDENEDSSNGSVINGENGNSHDTEVKIEQVNSGVTNGHANGYAGTHRCTHYIPPRLWIDRNNCATRQSEKAVNKRRVTLSDTQTLMSTQSLSKHWTALSVFYFC